MLDAGMQKCFKSCSKIRFQQKRKEEKSYRNGSCVQQRRNEKHNIIKFNLGVSIGLSFGCHFKFHRNRSFRLVTHICLIFAFHHPDGCQGADHHTVACPGVLKPQFSSPVTTLVCRLPRSTTTGGC